MSKTRKPQRTWSAVYLFVNLGLAVYFVWLRRMSYVPTVYISLAFVALYFLARDDFNLLQLGAMLVFAVINFLVNWSTTQGLIYYYYFPCVFYLIYALVRIFTDRAGFVEKLRKIGPPKAIAALAAAAFVYVAYCIANSHDRSVTFVTLKYHIVIIYLVCVFFLAMQSPQRRRVLFTFSKILLAGILLMGFLQMMKVNLHIPNKITDALKAAAHPDYYRRIPCVFFYNPNDYAVVLLVSLAMLSADVAFSRGRGRLLADALLLSAILVQYVVIMSRIGMFAFYAVLALGTLLLAVQALRRAKDAPRALVRFAACAAASILLIYGSTAALKQAGAIPEKTKMDQLANDMDFSSSDAVNSVSIRVQLIKNVVQGVVTEKHYLGLGPGNTIQYLKTCKNSNLTDGVIDVHSAWFELLGDYGIPAFLAVMGLFMWRFIVCVRAFFSRRDFYGPFALAVLLPAVFVAAFMPSSVINFPTFTVLFAAVMGASFVWKPGAEEETSNPPSA